MICPKCNSQINDNSKFCHMCGASVIPADENPNEATVSAAFNAEQEAQPVQSEPEQPVYTPAPEAEQAEYQPLEDEPTQTAVDVAPEPQQPVYNPAPEGSQPVYQPQPPVYTPTQQSGQPVYDPAPVQQPVYNQGQVYPPNQAGANQMYQQQFQQSQQRNQQFQNPNYVNQPPYMPGGNIDPQTAKKRSNALVGVIFGVVGAAVLAGIIFVIVLIVSGSGSAAAVNAFTDAINNKDMSLVKPYVFEEEVKMLDSYDFSSVFGTVTNGKKVTSKIVSTEKYDSGNSTKFESYASAVYNAFSSIGSAAAVTERNVVTVEFSIPNGAGNDTKTMYFDLAKVNGQWKIANLVLDRSSLSYLG